MLVSLLFLFSLSALAGDYPECAFYEKMEEATQCPRRENYLKKYGLKYCRKFSDLSLRVGADSKLGAWVNNTRQCLIQMIEKNPERYENNCFQLKEFAFDTHPICYKQYGVCDLSLREIYQVTKTFSGRSLFKDKRLNYVQTKNVLLACLAGHSRMSRRGQAFFKRVELDAPRLSPESIDKLISIVDVAPEEEGKMDEFYEELRNSSHPVSNKSLKALKLEDKIYPLTDFDSDMLLNKALLVAPQFLK